MTSPEPTPDLHALAVEAMSTKLHPTLGAHGTLRTYGSRAWFRPTTPDEFIDAVLAAVLPAHRAMVLAETGDPEPCPLDHGCEEGEVCGCWCDLHDCALAECPTFVTVEAWITGMREKHEAALARVRAMVLDETAAAVETLLDHYHQDLTLDTPADTAAYRAGRGAVMDAATVVRSLAATTPPARQDSPGTTGQATAVPEEGAGRG